MNFSDMITKIQERELKSVENLVDFSINKLTCDSREVELNDIFFAIKGLKQDGNNYITEALGRGAMAVFTDSVVAHPDPRIYKVEDCRKMMAIISNEYYGYPSLKMKITGITGTNGKTTVSSIINHVLKKCGKKTGLIGTTGNYIDNRYIKSIYTTPETITLFRLLKEMADEGVEYVTMEVSSHSLALKRVYGIEFDVAVFTNLTPEHLDFHGDMQSYFLAKKILFDGMKRINLKGNHTAVIYNCDDEYGSKIVQNAESERISYGTGCGTYTAENIKMDFYGMEFDVLLPRNGTERITVKTRLTGKFNIHNILASIAVLNYYNIPYGDIAAAVSEIDGVDGRFNVIKLAGGAYAIIDYAHTPDSLEKAILSVKEILAIKNSKCRLITVFGCGGDRDKSKRAVMGRIATSISDLAIITSDNPRYEDPLDIISDIIEGIRSDDYIIEPDREKAIVKAVEISRAGDVILIAGKGHEDYQEIRGERVKFSDKEIVGRYV